MKISSGNTASGGGNSKSGKGNAQVINKGGIYLFYIIMDT